MAKSGRKPIADQQIMAEVGKHVEHDIRLNLSRKPSDLAIRCLRNEYRRCVKAVAAGNRRTTFSGAEFYGS